MTKLNGGRLRVVEHPGGRARPARHAVVLGERGGGGRGGRDVVVLDDSDAGGRARPRLGPRASSPPATRSTPVTATTDDDGGGHGEASCGVGAPCGLVGPLASTLITSLLSGSTESARAARSVGGDLDAAEVGIAPSSVFLQAGGEGFEAASGVGLHRAGADAEGVGDLRLGQVEPVAEHQHRLLSGRQRRRAASTAPRRRGARRRCRASPGPGAWRHDRSLGSGSLRRRPIGHR